MRLRRPFRRPHSARRGPRECPPWRLGEGRVCLRSGLRAALGGGEGESGGMLEGGGGAREAAARAAAARAVAARAAVRAGAEPWSDSLTANPGQRLTVPDSLTALTALSLTA